MLNQYETARKWADYMLACAKERNPLYADQPQYHHETDGVSDADFIYDTRMHYGEWQEPIAKPKSDEPLSAVFMRMIKEGKPSVATAYMARSCGNVAHMAAILGKTDDAERYGRLTERIRAVYAKYLIDEDGVIEPGHQAAYVRALSMDLCGDKRDKVASQLIKEVEAANCHLNTGFLSTPFLLQALCDIGRSDLAFRILEQEDYPGWLHPITLGATTIPEAWNGFDVHDGSYNHYSYGAVCDFLFSRVAGIQPEFEHPGYQHFFLRPLPGGSLTWAEARYESVYGGIRSKWDLSANTYACEIPANTTATLTLPDGRAFELGSGSYTFALKEEDRE